MDEQITQVARQMLEREYLMQVRQALLLQLDAIERVLNITPRTSELRKRERERAKVPNTDNV
jgi:uncharacterized protein YnzC (UPF0291/DUF896 family)